MQIKTLATVVAATGMASVASADLTIFSQYDVWEVFSALNGDDVVFADSLDGFTGYADTASGTLGPILWSAVADGGLFGNGDYLSTNAANVQLVINLDPGVHGVGGNFFGTDINFNVVSSIVQVTLADGTSYVASVNTADQFIGFYTASSTINEITVFATDGTGNVWATADNLAVAVPAPGALALLGVAGGLGRRRRRN